MAGVTGLEPATSGVTGQRSNQLSYTPRTLKGGPDLRHPPATVKADTAILTGILKKVWVAGKVREYQWPKLAFRRVQIVV